MSWSLSQLIEGAPLRDAAAEVAAHVGESEAAVGVALDATLRVLLAEAGAMTASPFMTAAMYRSALAFGRAGGASAFGRDASGARLASGRPIADGSAAAVALFGTARLSALARVVATHTGLTAEAASRLPGIVVPALLAALAHEIDGGRLDAAGFASRLIDARPFEACPAASATVASDAAIGWVVRPD
jgi:hypothetical protein